MGKLKTYNCKACSREFSSRYRKEFCSKECFYGNRKNSLTKNLPVIKNCVICSEQFSVAFIYRKNVTCSRSCARALAGRSINMEEVGKTISKSRLEGIASGRIIVMGHPHSEETKKYMSKIAIGRSSGEKNGMFGKNHTDESRDSMSKTKAERMSAGLYDKSKRGNQGKRFFSKTGKEVFYRSSWEKKAMEMLENNPSVLSFSYEPFFIPYYRLHGKQMNLRHYVPDLLIEYSNGEKKLVEIKPKCYLEAAVNLAKFSAAREYCLKNGMTFEVWTQEDLDIKKL